MRPFELLTNPKVSPAVAVYAIREPFNVGFVAVIDIPAIKV